MTAFINGGVVTPFLRKFDSGEWLLNVILEELLDRMEKPLDQVDVVFLASNAVLEERVTAKFHEKSAPFITVTSPRAPVARGLYLAHRLIASGEARRVVIATINTLQSPVTEKVAGESETLSQRFSLDRTTLDDWAWRSIEHFNRAVKENPSPSWSAPLVNPEGNGFNVQDALLGAVDSRDTLAEEATLDSEPYAVTTKLNAAVPVCAGAALMLSAEEDGAILELMKVSTGRAAQHLSSISSLLALPEVLDTITAPLSFTLPELTSAHALAMVRLLNNEAFCESFLGLQGVLIENTDAINVQGGELAFGWAPGPSEIRHLLTGNRNGPGLRVILENDVQGQGFAILARDAE